MAVRVLQESQNQLTLELIGQDHTLANFVRRGLLRHKDTEYASYTIEHALVSDPVLLLTSRSEPKKVLLQSLEQLRSSLSALHDNVKKL